MFQFIEFGEGVLVLLFSEFVEEAHGGLVPFDTTLSQFGGGLVEHGGQRCYRCLRIVSPCNLLIHLYCLIGPNRRLWGHDINRQRLA